MYNVSDCEVSGVELSTSEPQSAMDFNTEDSVKMEFHKFVYVVLHCRILLHGHGMDQDRKYEIRVNFILQSGQCHTEELY